MFSQGELMRIEHALQSKINQLSEVIQDSRKLKRPNIETINNLINAEQANRDLLTKIRALLKD